MEKIIYPRYMREQDLRCKLLDEDIARIRELDKYGVSRKEIARLFKVHIYTVRRWCLSDKKRKEEAKKSYLCVDKEKNREIKRIRQRKSLKRKYKLMPEFKEYIHQYNNKNGRKVRK